MELERYSDFLSRKDRSEAAEKKKTEKRKRGKRR